MKKKISIVSSAYNEEANIQELYERVKSLLPEATDFLSVMDCLYALHAVDINDADEVFQCLLK